MRKGLVFCLLFGLVWVGASAQKASDLLLRISRQKEDTVKVGLYEKLFAATKEQMNAPANWAVFPNPATDEVNAALADEIISAELVSMTGQLIPVTVANGKIDVSTLASGIYILQMNGKAKAYRQKLVVAH